MPNQVSLEGDDDQDVHVQVFVPLWLKKKLVKAAKKDCIHYTAWVRQALLKQVREHEKSGR